MSLQEVILIGNSKIYLHFMKRYFDQSLQ